MRNYILESVFEIGSDWVCVQINEIVSGMIPHKVGSIYKLRDYYSRHFHNKIPSITYVLGEHGLASFYPVVDITHGVFIPKSLFTDKEVFTIKMTGDINSINWAEKAEFMTGIVKWHGYYK